jgi:hypothetical protein
MKPISFLLFFAVIILGCSPSFTVDTDWDSGYDFSQWQTFMLKPIGLRQGDAGQAVSQIRRELQRQLREKGYAESKENPDFLVAVHAISRQKRNVNVSSFGYGYGPYWRSRNVSVSTYREGTVIVDFVDPRNKELIWRGTLRTELSRNISIDDRKRMINEGVGELLYEFPPQ